MTHKYLPAPDDISAMTDEALGMWLLDSFGYGVMRERGLRDDEIDEATVLKFADALGGIEALSAQDAAVVAALRQAARAEFATAGKIMREHLNGGAIAMKFVPIGINKSRQAAQFGRAGARSNRAEGDANRKAVLDAARAILPTLPRLPSGRDLARLVARRTGLAFDTAHRHVAKLRKEKKL